MPACSRCCENTHVVVFNMMMPGESEISRHCLCEDCYGYYEQYEVTTEENEYDEDESHDIDADPIDAECEDDPIMIIHGVTSRDVDSDDPE